MIELEIIVYYSIIHLTHHKIRIYYFVICIHSELREHPIRILIRVTSAPNSYLKISISISVFVLKILK
jgi:hypothetical protein